MPVVPFVGGSYNLDAVSFDLQRTVNLYPIFSESGSSKSVAALRGTPGLKEFTTVGGGGIRGGIESQDRCFFVSGNKFYEISKTGVTTERGSLDTNISIVMMEENPTQIMIIDDVYGYIFNKTTNTFTKITDADFPTPSSLTFQDGYFVVTKEGSSIAAISALNDGLSWDQADRTTVESNPDNLVCVRSDSSNLWFFGTKNTEVFQNTGNPVFPFQRVSNAIVETGCAAKHTVQEIDNRLFWLGTDENGSAIVWASNGYSASRVSTEAIEEKIASSTNYNESYAWVYHERGHAFYILQIKALNTTLCFDITTGLWHERTYRNPDSGVEEQHKGICHVFFNKKHLIGDRDSNKIYTMSLGFYTDDGDPIIRKRVSPHYSNQNNLLSFASFELDMETGVGIQSGQGSDPQVMLSYSSDGGHTWSSELWRSFGKVGNYYTRPRWTKLGKSRDMVFQVVVSDPVFVQINEAIINGS